MATITGDTGFFTPKGLNLIVSIMQPTFLPWLGYFNLISRSDVFVFLDNVQFEARSWQQRNRIVVNGQAVWVTVPVSKPQGSSTLIKDILVNFNHFEPRKLSETLKRAYSGREGFDVLRDEVIPLIDSAGPRLAELNEALIVRISNLLNLEVTFVRASELKTFGSRSELLESILLNFDNSKYLSPKGSETYLDKLNGKFPSGINIEYQDFRHPLYNQRLKDFIPFMSTVDAICNVGISKTSELVR